MMHAKMLEKLRELNLIFRNNENAMRPVYLKLERQAQLLKGEGLISDFHASITVDAYTSNRKTIRRYKIEEDTPLYTSHCITDEIFKEDIYLHDDWSEGGNLGFKMCYSMHDFLYHQGIGWNDLIKIEVVYFDLAFTYQYKVPLIPKRN